MNSNESLARCLADAQAELNKIPYKDEYLKLELTYTHYEYVNDEFIQVSEGDRGEVYRSKVADTPEEFTEYLIYTTVKRYAFRQEVKVRRPFEDNRRQVNEIIVDCYSYMDDKYRYTLMTNLKDNIHIYFDLLDYYVKVSKNYLDNYLIHQEVQKCLSFIATKQYAGKSGGMYDVAFCFDWVRYQIECFLERHPDREDAFRVHENQYERLVELEKAAPHEQKWYRLGMWSRDVFARAEVVLEEVAVPKQLFQVACGDKKTDSAHQCAFYMLLIRLHTGRNLEQDLQRLLALAKEVDIAPFKKPLEQLFVTDEYGVFGREKAELRE